MSGLPQGWTTTTVGELADSIQYGHTASSTTEQVGPRFLRITDIQESKVDWDTVPFCQIPQSQIPNYRLAKGDLVFARTGATVGKSFLIQSEIPESIFASYLIRVRVTKAIDSRYLYYFFQSSDYWHQISDSSSGIGQPNVNGKKLAAITLPIAPLPEQRRIVARIEELFSRLDAGVAALRQAKAQLQRYRQSVLAAAVTGKLTQAWREQHPDAEPAEELLVRILEQRRKQWSGKGKYNEAAHPEILSDGMPSSWEYVRLDLLAEAVDPNPKHRNPRYVENGFPFLSTAQFARGPGFDLSTAKSVAEETVLEQERRCAFSNRSIAFSRKGTIGKTRFVPSSHRFALLDSLCVINPSPEIDERYLNAALNSNWVQMHINSRVRGVALKQISLGEVRGLPIPLPPLAEQHQIVADVEARTTAIDHLEAELDRQITRSNRLRQSTLAAAFSGALNHTSNSDGL